MVARDELRCTILILDIVSDPNSVFVALDPGDVTEVNFKQLKACTLTPVR